MKVIKNLFTKQAIVSSILILSIVAITMFSSYAYYLKIDSKEIAKALETDNLRISFSNDGYDQQVNINDLSILKEQKYVITLFNHGKNNVRYRLYLKNITETEMFTNDNLDNLLDKNLLNIQINDGELIPVTDDILYTGLIESEIESSHELVIKLSLKNDISPEAYNKELHYKFVVEEMPRNLYGEEDSLINTIFKNSEGIAEIENKIPGSFNLTALDNFGLYVTKDNDGNSYYFRGSVLNNNIIFGKSFDERDLLWKIVRINGDKTVRLVLASDLLPSFPELRINYNLIDGSNAFVGYNYGNVLSLDSNLVHDNINFSVAKDSLEKWYLKNIYETKYYNYLGNSIFCNDRSIASGKGIGRDNTFYGAYKRLNSSNNTINPSLVCNNEKDRLKVGNGLTYPIGLLTADETVFAGSTMGIKNSLYYLASNVNYWLMSPAYYDNGAYNYVMSGTSGLIANKVSLAENYLRPVINIKGDLIVLSGNGEIDNPFTLNLTDTAVKSNE